MSEAGLNSKPAQFRQEGMAMTQSPAGNSAAVAGERGRLRRSVPLIAGSLIAAVGLVFGSVAVASAQAGHHSPPPSIAQQAAAVKAQDAYTPVDGNSELNVNVLEDQVEHYYGSASATYPGVGAVTIASSTSNYAKQMKQIVTGAESYLAQAASRYHGPGKPAVVFDIDDTLLSTYDYTLAEQFGYDPATNQVWIDDAAFPAVFYMPQLVSFAAAHGFSLFYITGRPQSQTAATVKDLTSAGYAAPAAGHLFLKPSTPPPYLHCAAAPTCTTTEYKSGTRKYISSLGYTVVADFGDQYSDLLGGDAGHQVKLPNPMYYIP
jgi:predicted secreted acid phosphatase